MSTPDRIQDSHGHEAQVIERSADGSKTHVRLEDGRQVWIDSSALVPGDGRLRIPAEFEQVMPPEGTESPGDREERIVVPVVQERVRVERSEVETAVVRLHKTVAERQETIEEPVVRERVTVERVPINQLAEGPASVRYEGQTIVIPLLEEVLVVEKKLMIREEVRITRTRSVETAAQNVTLRTEQIDVDRVAAETSSKNTGS